MENMKVQFQEPSDLTYYNQIGEWEGRYIVSIDPEIQTGFDPPIVMEPDTQYLAIIPATARVTEDEHGRKYLVHEGLCKLYKDRRRPMSASRGRDYRPKPRPLTKEDRIESVVYDFEHGYTKPKAALRQIREILDKEEDTDPSS